MVRNAPPGGIRQLTRESRCVPVQHTTADNVGVVQLEQHLRFSLLIKQAPSIHGLGGHPCRSAGQRRSLLAATPENYQTFALAR